VSTPDGELGVCDERHLYPVAAGADGGRPEIYARRADCHRWPGGEGVWDMGVMALDPWLVDFFRAVDSMDAPTAAKAFAEEGTFRFGNSEPAVGRQEVEENMAGFFSMIGGLGHEITGVWSGSWEGGEVRSVEAEVTYTLKDGTRTQPLPVTSTIRLKGDRISDYRIFMDLAPLFAQKA